MKTMLSAIVGVFLATGQIYSQGTFTFANTADSLVMYQTNGSSPDFWLNPQLAPVPAGGGRVEVLWAPVGTTDHFQFQRLGASVSITPIAGRFSGGVRTVPAGTGFFGIPAGGDVALFVRGWLGPASTWEDALYGPNWSPLIAMSGIFTITTGDPTTFPASTPASLTPGFPGLSLLYIPEPSIASLTGFGVACLWLFKGWSASGRKPERS